MPSTAEPLMSSPSPLLCRIAREDCQPGDWIEAALVPEWFGAEGRRTFTPGAVSISPESGRLGGVLPEHPGEAWEFELRTDGEQRYWVRVS